MFNLSPKEDKFYTLFVKNAEIAHEAAIKLKEYAEDITGKPNLLSEIKDIEHKGDSAVREVIEELNKTFLTPFDREDIYAITKEMDHVVNCIEKSASRFDMFNVTEARKGTKELCDMIEIITAKNIEVMKLFSTMNKTGALVEVIAEVNKIESDGDIVSRKAIKELFSGSVDAIEVIRWREIYKHLENTLDACHHVANIVEGVVMKNA